MSWVQFLVFLGKTVYSHFVSLDPDWHKLNVTALRVYYYKSTSKKTATKLLNLFFLSCMLSVHVIQRFFSALKKGLILML